MLPALRAPTDSISVSSAASPPSGFCGSLGDVNAAVDHLLPLVETEEGVSLWPAHAARTLSTAVEALVAAGTPSEAQPVVDRLEEHARAIGVPSAEAAAARCRALMLAQDGDVDAARDSIETALGEHARLHEPFELARTYLAQGSIERRAKQKAGAREALRRRSDLRRPRRPVVARANTA